MSRHVAVHNASIFKCKCLKIIISSSVTPSHLPALLLLIIIATKVEVKGGGRREDGNYSCIVVQQAWRRCPS
jgi:hypothetical protein